VKGCGFWLVLAV